MSELAKHRDHGKFLDQILKLDQNIRCAAIYDGKYHAKSQDRVGEVFKEQEFKSSFSEAQDIWSFPEQMSIKIGEPRFTEAQYGEVNRITFPIGNVGLVLVITELHIDVNKVVDNILETHQALENDVRGFFYR